MMRMLFLCVVCAAFVGCSRQPLQPTDDSRTKAAFGIWEWSLTPGYDEGFSFVVFDGANKSQALTCKPGETIRSVYLQKSPESGDYVVKIDAGNGGFYGSVIPDPFAGLVPRHHRAPLKSEGLWVLVNDQDGIADSDGRMSAYIAMSFPGTGGFEPADAAARE
jgi:hypothetical protein